MHSIRTSRFSAFEPSDGVLLLQLPSHLDYRRHDQTLKTNVLTAVKKSLKGKVASRNTMAAVLRYRMRRKYSPRSLYSHPVQSLASRSQEVYFSRLCVTYMLYICEGVSNCRLMIVPPYRSLGCCFSESCCCASCEGVQDHFRRVPAQFSTVHSTRLKDVSMPKYSRWIWQ